MNISPGQLRRVIETHLEMKDEQLHGSLYFVLRKIPDSFLWVVLCEEKERVLYQFDMYKDELISEEA